MKFTLLLIAAFAATAAASENFFWDPRYSDENGVLEQDGEGRSCLPAQWEGRVGSFYMRSRFLRPVFRISDSKVGIDYKNKKFASRSLMYCRKCKKVYQTRSIADFGAKKAYFIYKNKCRVFKLNKSLPSRCLPSDFRRFAQYSYGAGSTSLVLSPYGKRDSRLEYFIALVKGSNVPVKGAYRTRKGKRTITYGKYQYYNITTGNTDRQLYVVPPSCNQAEEEEPTRGVFGRLRNLMSESQPFSTDSDMDAAGDEMTSHIIELINGNGAMLQKSKPNRASRWLTRIGDKVRKSFE